MQKIAVETMESEREARTQDERRRSGRSDETKNRGYTARPEMLAAQMSELIVERMCISGSKGATLLQLYLLVLRLREC